MKSTSPNKIGFSFFSNQAIVRESGRVSRRGETRETKCIQTLPHLATGILVVLYFGTTIPAPRNVHPLPHSKVGEFYASRT